MKPDTWHRHSGLRLSSPGIPADPVKDAVLIRAYCFHKPEETARYAETLDRLRAQAASPRETIGILRDIQKEI